MHRTFKTYEDYLIFLDVLGQAWLDCQSRPRMPEWQGAALAGYQLALDQLRRKPSIWHARKSS